MDERFQTEGDVNYNPVIDFLKEYIGKKYQEGPKTFEQGSQYILEGLKQGGAMLPISRFNALRYQKKLQQNRTKDGLDLETGEWIPLEQTVSKVEVSPLFKIKKQGKYSLEYEITDKGWEALKKSPYAEKLRLASTRETLGSKDQLKDLFYVSGSPRVIPRDAGFSSKDIISYLEKYKP